MATTTDTVKIITNDSGWKWKIEPSSYVPDDAFSLFYRESSLPETKWVCVNPCVPHDDAKAIAFAILSLLGEMPPKA